MRQILTRKIKEAIERAREKGDFVSQEVPADLTVEVPKIASHGDWSTNAAMVLAPIEKKPPRVLAEIIIANIEDPEGFFDRIEVAGSGFINFILTNKWWHQVLRDIDRLGPDYGRLDLGRGQKVLVEFVSTNPTGPLHVGHARGAALGDALSRLLEMVGFEISREYYVNDTGNQARTLGRSVLCRYLEKFGRKVEYTDNLYQGDYIRDLAGEVKEGEGDRFLDMPEEKAVEEIYPWAIERILEGIREDLLSFHISFDSWFSEKSLVERGQTEKTLDFLRDRGHIYDKDGAVWFRSSDFGDDKDRPVIRCNGVTTYMAPDLVYHLD